jgi:hypothetical protein
LRAIPLLREAAESALSLGALAEAAAYWRQAAQLGTSADPEGAARDRAREAEALSIIAGLREATPPPPPAGAVATGGVSAGGPVPN